MRSSFLALAMLSFCVSSAMAGAEQIHVELNKLAPQGEACRAYLVLENGTASAFESLKLDLVMFDGEGVVAKRLAVETAPLPPGKTRLKVFDMEGLACERVGRVLLNAILACADATGPREDCLGLVAVSARGGREFIK